MLGVDFNVVTGGATGHRGGGIARRHIDLLATRTADAGIDRSVVVASGHIQGATVEGAGVQVGHQARHGHIAAAGHGHQVFIAQRTVLQGDGGGGGHRHAHRAVGRHIRRMVDRGIVTVQRGVDHTGCRVVQVANQVGDREVAGARHIEHVVVNQGLGVDLDGIACCGPVDRQAGHTRGDVDQVIGGIARAQVQRRVAGQAAGVQIGGQTGDHKIGRAEQHQFLAVCKSSGVDRDRVAALVALDRHSGAARIRQGHGDGIVRGVVHQHIVLNVGVGVDGVDVDDATNPASDHDLVVRTRCGNVKQTFVLRLGHGLRLTVIDHSQGRAAQIGTQTAVEAHQRVAARRLDGVHSTHITRQGQGVDLDHIQSGAAIDRLVANRQGDGAALCARLEDIEVFIFDIDDLRACGTGDDTRAKVEHDGCGRLAARIQRVTREGVALDMANAVVVGRLGVGIQHHIGCAGGGVKVTIVGADREGRRRTVEVRIKTHKTRRGRHAVDGGVELDDDVFTLLVVRPQTTGVDHQVGAHCGTRRNHDHDDVGLHVAQIGRAQVELQGASEGFGVGGQGDVTAHHRELHVVGAVLQFDHIAFTEVQALDGVIGADQRFNFVAVDDAVRTSAQHDAVPTHAGVNGVIAGAGDDGVRTTARDDAVVAVANINQIAGAVDARFNGVIALAGINGVGTLADMDQVVAVARDDVVIAFQRRHGVVAVARVDQVGTAARHDGVMAFADSDRVGPRATDHGVVAVTAVDQVVTVARRDRIIAVRGVDGVVAGTGADGVVAIIGIHQVGPFAAVNHVIAIARNDGVAKCAAGDGVVAMARGDVELAVGLCRTVPVQGIATHQGRAIHIQRLAGGHQGIHCDHVGIGVAQRDVLNARHPIEFIAHVGAVGIGVGQGVGAGVALDGIAHRQAGAHGGQVIIRPHVDVVITAQAGEGVGTGAHAHAVVAGGRIGHLVVAIAGVNGVIAPGGGDHIIAVTGHDRVAAGATVDGAVGSAEVACDIKTTAVGFVATIPVQGIDRIIGIEIDRQDTRRSNQAVLRDHIGVGRIQRNGFDARDVVQLGAIRGAGIGVVQQIGARAAVDGIARSQRSAKVDGVVVVAQEHRIIATGAVEDVVAIAHHDGVVEGSCVVDQVVARTGDDQVRTTVGDHGVIAAIGGDGVVVRAADDRIVAIGRRDVELAIGLGRAIPHQRAARGGGEGHVQGLARANQAIDRGDVGVVGTQHHIFNVGHVVEFVACGAIIEAQGVGAIARVDRVGTALRAGHLDRVVAFTRMDQVGTGAGRGRDGVIAIQRIDGVAARAQHKGFRTGVARDVEVVGLRAQVKRQARGIQHNVFDRAELVVVVVVVVVARQAQGVVALTALDGRVLAFANDHVVAGAAKQAVAVVAADDGVIAVAAREHVTAVVAHQGVVASPTVHRLGAVAAPDRVVATARHQGGVLGVAQVDAQVFVLLVKVDVQTIDGHAQALEVRDLVVGGVIEVGTECQQVVAIATLEQHVVLASQHGVIAGAGVDHVVAIARDDAVGAIATQDGVVLIRGNNGVTKVRESNVKGLTNLVGKVQNGRRAVAADHDLFNALQRGIAVRAEVAAHHQGVGARIALDGVVVLSAVDRVVTEARLDQVCAVARNDRVIARACVDGIAAIACDDGLVAVARIDPVVALANVDVVVGQATAVVHIVVATAGQDRVGIEGTVDAVLAAVRGDLDGRLITFDVQNALGIGAGDADFTNARDLGVLAHRQIDQTGVGLVNDLLDAVDVVEHIIVVAQNSAIGHAGHGQLAACRATIDRHRAGNEVRPGGGGVSVNGEIGRCCRGDVAVAVDIGHRIDREHHRVARIIEARFGGVRTRPGHAVGGAETTQGAARGVIGEVVNAQSCNAFREGHGDRAGVLTGHALERGLGHADGGRGNGSVNLHRAAGGGGGVACRVTDRSGDGAAGGIGRHFAAGVRGTPGATADHSALAHTPPQHRDALAVFRIGQTRHGHRCRFFAGVDDIVGRHRADGHARCHGVNADTSRRLRRGIARRIAHGGGDAGRGVGRHIGAAEGGAPSAITGNRGRAALAAPADVDGLAGFGAAGARNRHARRFLGCVDDIVARHRSNGQRRCGGVDAHRAARLRRCIAGRVAHVGGDAAAGRVGRHFGAGVTHAPCTTGANLCGLGHATPDHRDGLVLFCRAGAGDRDRG